MIVCGRNCCVLMVVFVMVYSIRSKVGLFGGRKNIKRDVFVLNRFE